MSLEDLKKPGLPVYPTLIDPSNLYILYYRHGSNPNCMKFFTNVGTLHDAHEVGTNHCNVMGYHFIWVKPFLSNLREDEKKKLRPFGSGPVKESDGTGINPRSS